MECSETIKQCSICGEKKEDNMFVISRNLCKSCRNKKTRDDYAKLNVDNEITQKCNVCEIMKNIKEFYKGRKICCTCTSKKRREKYNNDENYRVRVKKDTTKYRKAKNWVDNPLEELKRKVRSNIRRGLKEKTKRTMDYLGCSREEYAKWLFSNNHNYTLENHGNLWHIDHVIPLSTFNLKNDKEQYIAFNWRNTTPLSCKENLSKNNKILKSQIVEHCENLKKYHEENNIDLPQEFIDLFAKHLDAGSSLESSLPLTLGNICEDLS